MRLDEVVLHALEEEPERRYQQAKQVKGNVEVITASAPLKAGSSAMPPQALTPAPEKRRNGRIAFFVGTAILVMLGLGLWVAGLGLAAGTGIAVPPGLVGWWRGEGDGEDSVGRKNGILVGAMAFP